MIPQRLRLSGFLSYREPQVLDFTAACLWLLVGANGSGKSAVFDAITWALFGAHRGGTFNAGELIHKSSERCDIEFDFQLGDAEYRVERSLRITRNGTSGTQGILKHDGRQWHPVPETNRKAGFDDWIHRHLGLTFDAFTASVLLRQGHAEKLLDATPKGRAEILASAVHLERYQALHAQANAEKLKQKAIVDTLDTQRQITVAPSDEEVAKAIAELSRAEAAIVAVRQSLDAAEQQLAGAHRFAAVQNRLDQARQEAASAHSLLTAADAIRKEHTRLLELAAVLPLAESVVVTHARQNDSQHRSERFLKQQEIVKQQQSRLDHELTTAKGQRQELAKSLAGDEAKIATTGQRLRILAAALQTMKLVEEQTAELARLDDTLAAGPQNLPQRLAASQVELERLQKLVAQLPRYEQAVLQQAEAELARARLYEAREASDRIRLDGDTARKQHDALQAELDAAERELVQSESASMEAAVQQRLALAAMESVSRLAGHCDACGQSVSEEHRCEEAARRESKLVQCEAVLAESVSVLAQGRSRCESLRGQVAQSNAVLQELRRDYKEQSLLQAAAARELETHDRDAIKIEPDALAAMQSDCAKLPGVQREVRELQEQFAARQALEEQQQRTASSLTRLRSQLPPQADGLRSEQQAKQAEEASLVAAVKAGKRALDDADRDLDRLGRENHTLLAELTDLTGHLRSEEGTREHCREIIDRAMAKLTPDWQMRVESAGLSDYNQWRDAERELRAARVPERFRELEMNPWSHREAEVQRLEAELAVVPAEERQAPEEVRASLAALRVEVQVAEADAATWRQLVRLHTETVASQARFDEKALKAERELARWKRLADLLGRDGLQRQLVRNAERAIVIAANRFLGGTITLLLADDGEADKALELQAVIAGSSIAVAFLSGSQRFRVAVALALALGDFMGRTGPPCLMIDEGFGSLDIESRSAMIRELHLLSETLPRILVVSHDDDFAAAFEHSYRFEVVDSATQVRSSLPG